MRLSAILCIAAVRASRGRVGERGLPPADGSDRRFRHRGQPCAGDAARVNVPRVPSGRDRRGAGRRRGSPSAMRHPRDALGRAADDPARRRRHRDPGLDVWTDWPCHGALAIDARAAGDAGARRMRAGHDPLPPAGGGVPGRPRAPAGGRRPGDGRVRRRRRTARPSRGRPDGPHHRGRDPAALARGHGRQRGHRGHRHAPRDQRRPIGRAPGRRARDRRPRLCPRATRTARTCG